MDNAKGGQVFLGEERSEQILCCVIVIVIVEPA